MRCAACGFDNPADAHFCGSCGQALAGGCPACGAENPPGFRFCGRCGTALAAEATADEREAVAASGERRRVTVLFADLVGFSTLAEHLDPEELRTLMSDTFAELTEEVERRGGTVEKFIGDAVVAVYGAPTAHEDDPLRAIEGALAMLEVVGRRSRDAPAPLQLRIGVNSGLVIAGPLGDGSQTGVMGDAVNVAARLQQGAAPGEVIVSASTWRQVRDRVAGEPIGALEVKGRTQPVDAYRVLGPRKGEQRRRAPFVGRREELALLDLLWSSVRKGNTHVVSIMGEPGVGKSRLLAELLPRQDALDVRISCSSARAFGSFLELVERILGGLPTDAAELQEKTASLGLDHEDALLLAAFLGLAGAPPVVRMADEQGVRQVFAGVWQLVVAAARQQPLLVAFDDVHWADESSRDLLAFLLEQLGGVPVLLLLLYRAGFQPHGSSELRASHTGIRLEALTPEESIALARGYLGVEHLPTDLERLIAGRAEGNPFFIEELLQALLELGSLAVADGRAALAKVEIDIPDTVQGTILARLDRLDPRARGVLQHAAVLGRTFSSVHLELVVGDGELGEPLSTLAQAQLLMLDRPGYWSFKHALIQEVTYETLLLRRRRELHLKVAEALEGSAGDDPQLLEALAEHYARAEAREAARRTAVAAGDIARDRMGFVEAKRRYETALRLWGEGDEEGRLELLLTLGSTAHLAGDTSTARVALVEAADGWHRLGRPAQAGSALATLGRVHWVGGDTERAAQVLEEAIATLEALGPSPELVQSYTWASTLHMLQGSVDESTPLAERGLAMAEELGLDGFRAHLLNTLGSSQVFAGDHTGIERIEQALALALEAGDAEAIGRGYVNLGSALDEIGQGARAIEVDREGRETMRRLGAPQFETFIAGNEAAGLVHVGRLKDAETLARELLEEHRPVLGVPGIVSAGMTLLEVALRRGRYDDARQIRDEILPLARGLGGAEFLGGTLAIVAWLEHSMGNLASARQAIEEAVGICFATPAREHWLRVLPAAARMLPPVEVAALLDRAHGSAATPMAEARLAEAEGLARRDGEASHRAADIYRSMQMPYEEARCRLDAQELGRARELIDAYGFGDGPLGCALRDAEAGGG
jgi:class 3 adenylate cyclase/tetratricopeptide (TPR) repeat protein